VVQHIGTAFYGVNRQPGPDDETWSLAFTQEWPVFTQTHQFSYTIPYTFSRSGGGSVDGLGDMLLNYRFQAYFDERSLTAFAPRASLVLPTGDETRGLGDDTVGCQFSLPFSTTVGDDWFVHLNAGLTYLPDAASAQQRDLTSYNVGASVIYAATRELHFMLEWVGSWNQFGEPGVPRDREFAAVISPGVRKAFNFQNESQLVLGIAAPLGLNGPAPDVGVFLYVSFEHFLPGSR
jgi:Putative MetA-pathway of phenol degradation